MSEWFDGSSAELIDDGDYFESDSAGFTGDVEIRIEQGSFTVAPFLWPHVASKVLADVVSNVTTLKVYGEGTDGSRVLINNNQPGVTKSKTAGHSTEYAGSWAQDFGAGIVTDTGIDHAPTTGGISGTVMGSAHLATAFQMLADRTYEAIILVCTPTDPTEAIEVNLGLQYDNSSSRKIVWENAHQCAIIHPSGPGVRTGHFNTGTSGTLDNPPNVYDPTERSNAIDGLIVGRLLVEGIAHDDGLTTELTALYDTTEGQSVGQVRNNSHWFWLPVTSGNWIMAVVNSMSEVPPLCEYPTRERNATTWAEDGDFVQHVWCGMQGPSYFINPKTAVELREDDDTTVWTSPESSIAGWAISGHSHAVVNDETDFGIWITSRYAELRPFRGHYMVIWVMNPGAGPWNLSTPWGQYHRLDIDSSDVTHRRAEQPVPFGGFDSEEMVLSGYEWARATYDPTTAGIVGIVYDGTDVYTSQTNDEGTTYNTVAALLTNVEYPTINHTANGGLLAAGFRLDTGTSGTIVGKYKEPGDTAWSSEFEFEDSSAAISFEQDSFHFTPAPNGADLMVLVAKKAGDTGATEFYSSDNGLTWTEV